MLVFFSKHAFSEILINIRESNGPLAEKHRSHLLSDKFTILSKNFKDYFLELTNLLAFLIN